MDYGFANKGPFVIRYPKAKCPNPLLSETEPAVPGRGVFIKNNNSPVLLIGTGSMTKEMILVSENLELNGIPADVYNLRFIKPIDREYLKKITINYRYIFTAEESSLLGGIGEEILSILKENNPSQKVINFGVPDSFITNGPRSILLKYCGLDAGSLTDSILKHLKKAHIPHLKHRTFLRGSQG
ncbi:MAG: hypothetical protein DRP57_05870 [Spirochaetes bacterium]|nr:MAG: hypothetical protein DRP57_05870 [Spirochaetota bacterium]